MRLPFGGTNYFTIRDDNTPVSQLLFGVSNTSITTQLQLNMQGKKISLLGTPTSDSDATTKLHVDQKITTAGVASKLNIDGSNAMTGDLNLGTKSITNVRLITATQISLTSGNSSQFLKGDGSLDEKTYVQQSALTNSAIAYINSSGQLSSSASNLYVQKGVNTIQSALNAIITNTYSSIQLSSGQFIEDIVLTKSFYSLFGPARISGNMTIGSSRLRQSNIYN